MKAVAGYEKYRQFVDDGYRTGVTLARQAARPVDRAFPPAADPS